MTTQWRIQDSPERGGVVFLPKNLMTFFSHPPLRYTTLSFPTKSDDFFSRHPLWGVRVPPKAPSKHQIQPPPYNNCFKKFFLSEGGS